MLRFARRLWVLGSFSLLLVESVGAQAPHLASVNLAGVSGNGISGSVFDGPSPGISAAGDRVVFESRATDLVVLPDTNGSGTDIFSRDFSVGLTRLVSQNRWGTATGNAASHSPVASDDGRWIAFSSSATDLVEETTAGFSNVYLHDLALGTSRLVSVATSGISGGNGASSSPIISSDGNWVVFTSEATDLVIGTDTNGEEDLFAWNRSTGSVSLVTESFDGSGTGAGFAGAFEPVLSVGPSPRVVFASTFNNLVSGDTNSSQDVFSRRLPDGPTEVVHGIATGGWSSRPVISATADWIAFTSDAPGLVPNDANGKEDCFLRDEHGVIHLVSTAATGEESADNHSTCMGVNADRGFVLFESASTNLAPNDTNGERDVFLHEILSGSTFLVSRAAGGGDAGNDVSLSRTFSSISRSGRFVVFESFATDLETVDGDGAIDVFVYDHCVGITHLMNPNSTGTGSGSNESDHARISRDGRWVTFSSRATDLVGNDGNGWIDTFRAEVPGWTDAHCGSLDLFFDGFESGDADSWSSST